MIIITSKPQPDDYDIHNHVFKVLKSRSPGVKSGQISSIVARGKSRRQEALDQCNHIADLLEDQYPEFDIRVRLCGSRSSVVVRHYSIEDYEGEIEFFIKLAYPDSSVNIDIIPDLYKAELKKE